MTVWVPKGLYNSVEPLWDKRYAWHPMAVDDSLPIDHTSFVQFDKKDGKGPDPHSKTPNESNAAPEEEEEETQPEESDSASVQTQSTLGSLPKIERPGLGRRGTSGSNFGFPVRQMTWNTSRRKRDALMQRQKARDKFGITGKPPARAQPLAAKDLDPTTTKDAATKDAATKDAAATLDPNKHKKKSSRASFGAGSGEIMMFAL